MPVGIDFSDPVDDGFSWTGPLIGLMAAFVAVGIWSITGSRRKRFAGRKR